TRTGYSLRDYEIQASDDDTNWTTVYSATGVGHQEETLPLDTPTKARYFRLYVTDINRVDPKRIDLEEMAYYS
ncbi:MAG TPA: discoidin domain-containing protein, partial [Oceanipulchritudo sp.]|nr:discoidin domain-containing protein [Oceanipulchritudo sp.]